LDEAEANVNNPPAPSERQRWIESVRKVLVVDDESNMRFLLRMVFESEGFEVVEAHHGAAALERVKEEEPDLVVTDLMMPVMNGRQLVERLRADAETAGIPILVLSANANAEVVGADAALRKPFDVDALLDAARSLSRKDAA
jgi:two-component system chemotaxis response regulator CheY